MSKEEQHSKLDESLKKALESIDSAYSPDDWSDLEQRMNQHSAFKKLPNKNQGFKFGKGLLLNTFIICGTIAAASASFALFYSTSNGSKQAKSELTPAASGNGVQNNANSLTPLSFNNNTLSENEISTATATVPVNNVSGSAPGASKDAGIDADKNHAPAHDHSLKINTTSEKENISANENNIDNASRKLNANASNTVTNNAEVANDKLAAERAVTKNSLGNNKHIANASSSKNDGKNGLEANKVRAKGTTRSSNKQKAGDRVLAEKVTDLNHTGEESNFASLNNTNDKKENASSTKVAAEKAKSINSKKSNKTYSSNKLNTNTNGAVTKQKQLNANNAKIIINSSNSETTGTTQNTNETEFATMLIMKAKSDLLQNKMLVAPAIKPAAAIAPADATFDGNPKSPSSAASDNYFVNFWENPGYTGAEERHTFNAAYKNQWVQLRNNPVDFALGYNGAVGKNKKNGIGIYFGGTDATFSTKRVLGIAYSYKLTFNTVHIVRIGLGLSANQKGINTSSYTDNSMIDPVKGFVRQTSTMYTTTGSGYLDPNVGIWYGFRQFYFGVSALRLTQPEETFYGSLYKMPALFYINTGYRFSLNNSWSLTPSIAVKHTYGVYTNYNPLILLTYKDDVFAGVTYQNFNMCSVQAGATLFRSLRLFVSAGTPANKKLRLLGSLGTVEAGIRYQLPSHAKTETK